MPKDDVQTEAGAPNWLRTATLLLTLFSPVINNMAARLAERLEQGGKRVKVEDMDVEEIDIKDLPDVIEVQQAEIVEPGQSLSAALQNLKDSPYSRQLLKQRDNLTDGLQALIDRSSQLSQSLLARGNDVTSDLVERGNQASQELLRRSDEARKELRKRGKKLNKQLSKRSKKLSKELRKRSDRVAKELRKRSRQVASQTSEQSGLFWTIAGFSVGLTAAAIVAFVMLRQRIRQQQELEASQSLQTAQDSYLNATQAATSSRQGAEFTAAATSPEAVVQTQASTLEDTAPAVAVQETGAPAGAAYVGIIETRRYYPVTTRPDQLAAGGRTDLVYFSSEEEAKAEGYVTGA